MADHLARFREEADPEGSALLIIVDLDEFKQVNDRWGHVKGDEALVVLSERLNGVVRHREGTLDCVARIGGDEFMILFDLGARDLDQGALDELCESLRGRVNNQLEFDVDEHTKVMYQASVGMKHFKVKELGADGENFSSIKAQADANLYGDKNRIADRSPVLVSKIPTQF
jgi:diguanylate cyclase (GGDEF)-like protein